MRGRIIWKKVIKSAAIFALIWGIISTIFGPTPLISNFIGLFIIDGIASLIGLNEWFYLKVLYRKEYAKGSPDTKRRFEERYSVREILAQEDVRSVPHSVNLTQKEHSFCSKGGTKVNLNSKFCTSCGNKVRD